MKATVKLNERVTLMIEEQKEMETLHKAIILANYPKVCSKCNGGAVILDSNKDKEANVYVNVVCLKCGAKAKLGQYKAGGYFWHRDFEIYNKNQSAQADEVPPEFDENGQEV